MEEGGGEILEFTFRHNSGCHSPHIPIKERDVSRRQPHDRAGRVHGETTGP